MLNICANVSWLFREHEFVDRFAAAGEAGFAGVEFHDPEGVDPTTVARAARDAGVTIALFNASIGDFVKGGPGLSGVPGREEEFRRVVGEACALYSKSALVGRCPLLARCPAVLLSQDATRGRE